MRQPARVTVIHPPAEHLGSCCCGHDRRAGDLEACDCSADRRRQPQLTAEQLHELLVGEPAWQLDE